MQIDREIFLWIQGLTGNPLLDLSMVALAEYLVLLVPTTLIYLWFKDRETSLFTFYTAITGITVSYILGLMYAHSNPSAFFDTIAAYSMENAFPSQHTTTIIATALPLLQRKKPVPGLILLVSGLLTGFARIYIGEHWPIDILGAILASTTALVITSMTWQHLENIWKHLINFSHRIEEKIGEIHSN